MRLPPRVDGSCCRMRANTCVTLIRLRVRRVLNWPAFPLVPALCSTNSAADRSALFVGFTATMTESDFSGPFIIGYGSSPSRCGPATATPFRSDPRSPSFRCDPFARDVAFDPGRASAPRIKRCRTCCLRAIGDPRPLRHLIFRGSIPHPIQSLCTLRDYCRQQPRNTRYQADATPYLGRTFTGWIAPACCWRTLIRSPHLRSAAAVSAMRDQAHWRSCD
jgi:hypothetical protein